MRILIAFDGVKREIDGDFHICALRDDIEILKECCEAWLARDGNYGWMEVRQVTTPPTGFAVPWRK